MLNPIANLKIHRVLFQWIHHLDLGAISRWALGSTICALGLGLSADRLIQLGAMRTSLTSSNEMTRALAHLEVGIARITLVLMGLMIIFVVPRLSALAANRRIKPLLKPMPQPIEEHQISVFNWPAILMLLAAVATASGVMLHETPRLLTAEDGPFEQFTAVAFLVAGVAALWGTYRRGWGLRAVPLAGLGLFFVMAAGEEISWGQRIIGLQTPALMQTYNVQGETNLHNLFGYVADHAFIAGTFLFGGVLPLLCLRWQPLRRLAWHLGIPVGSIGLALAFIGVSLLHQWTIGAVGPAWASVRVAEIRETLTGLAFLILIMEALSADKAVEQSPATANSGLSDLATQPTRLE